MIGPHGRFRSPAAVVDEMEALSDLGFQHVRIEDDLFTFRRDRALAICRELDRRGLSVRWRAYARVDTVDAGLVALMRRTGCERILFGAESGSPEILRRIRKGITPDQTRRAVQMTREAGIGVLASFVLGLPGETPQTLRQTLEFADSLGVPYSLNLLTPYVGTEIRERAAEWGVKILTNDWRLYGQGCPLTATATVGPRHLSRVISQYRRGIHQYLDDLLERERRGILTGGNAQELHRHRHWNFLRRLIGEELLERYGTEGNSPEGLAEALAPRLGMAVEETKRHLDPHLRDGHIRPVTGLKGFQWAWA
jgi:radical SAM superfamily enzyme YgiQ (UPF0313 family)